MTVRDAYHGNIDADAAAAMDEQYAVRYGKELRIHWTSGTRRQPGVAGGVARQQRARVQ
ncbi:hypothetical protein PI124_g21948 [Phytophthora idaei]|nr:hypothetical protein PI125_g23816 [Phytophthora idaei]KAG3127518.1 hypothetical protein PI126_g21815 [Phytophthora idaei]KAG3232975.1 hypothetical protein PI124_g21948 [Phytophthora idaei]